MSEAPASRAGAPARRGRPPLSSYPTADGISRESPRARPPQGGPPRKRGRPPKSAAPPEDGHAFVFEAMRPTTPTSFVELQESAQDPSKRAESAAPAPTADKTPPALVFQCARCLTVVGDSFSWITAQRQLSMIVLREATEKVAVVGPVITSSEPGQGLGSTYSVLQCTHCTQHLGRQYHETPRALDELRSAFSFHVDAIIVYVANLT